jgi:hypothetical protein
MNYGRNINVDIAQGSTERFTIEVDEESAEAVRADFDTTSGTVGAGSLDVNLYYWDNEGDLREVEDGDSGSWTQIGSTYSTSDDAAHGIGALIPEDAGFAILEVTNSGDSGEVTISGDFLHNEHHEVPDGRSALEHATDGNLSFDAYTDGTAQ